jgi:hypothetical protein
MDYKDSRSISGWIKRLSRKSPGWELVCTTNLQDSQKIPVRSKGTSRKNPVCDKEHQIYTQKSLENSGLPMEFIYATAGNRIPGQD